MEVDGGGCCRRERRTKGERATKDAEKKQQEMHRHNRPCYATEHLLEHYPQPFRQIDQTELSVMAPGMLAGSFKLNCDTLQPDNEALLKKRKELKSRLLLQEESNTESHISVKEEMITLQDSNPLCETAIYGSDSKELSYECFNKSDEVLGAFKDRSSDSDSSAILNEENSNNNHNSPNNTTISSSGFQKQFSTQYMKMEEHNFLSTDKGAVSSRMNKHPRCSGTVQRSGVKDEHRKKKIRKKNHGHLEIGMIWKRSQSTKELEPRMDKKSTRREGYKRSQDA
ncbi:hypothetical protein V8G54_009382 [Vigna mungo]|uniref:Uncharacterized protein n=1 Tax=Vigna mungo TaxID=3915 RepID=A0AAQ3NV31_VIGMU